MSESDPSAVDLPPLPEVSAPPAPFPWVVNGQPSTAYVACRYLRGQGLKATPEDREFLEIWRAGWSVLRRFEDLCTRLGWPAEAQAIDWFAAEYAMKLGKAPTAGYELPFAHLLAWGESQYRPPTAAPARVRTEIATETPPPPPPPRIVIDRKSTPPTITVDGTTHAVTAEQAAFVGALQENTGPPGLTYKKIVETTPELQDFSAGKLGRDVRDRLPLAIRQLIQTAPGKGCWLKLD